jgi:hypothetical protein
MPYISYMNGGQRKKRNSLLAKDTTQQVHTYLLTKTTLFSNSHALALLNLQGTSATIYMVRDKTSNESKGRNPGNMNSMFQEPRMTPIQTTLPPPYIVDSSEACDTIHYIHTKGRCTIRDNPPTTQTSRRRLTRSLTHRKLQQRHSTSNRIRGRKTTSEASPGRRPMTRQLLTD